jgi:hypothetical protein
LKLKVVKVAAIAIIAISVIVLVLNVTGVLGGTGYVSTPPKTFIYIWAILAVLGAFGFLRTVRYGWIHGTTRGGVPVSKASIIFGVIIFLAVIAVFAGVQLGFIRDYAS